MHLLVMTTERQFKTSRGTVLKIYTCNMHTHARNNIHNIIEQQHEIIVNAHQHQIEYTRIFIIAQHHHG